MELTGTSTPELRKVRDNASKARWRAKNPDYHKQWRARNRDHAVQYEREYGRRPDVRKRNNAASRKWYAANKVTRKKWEERRKKRPDYADTLRDFALKKKYGITSKQKREMMARQGNRCAAAPCGHVFKNIADASVDHCHKTGRVRLLLCNRCNTGMGLLRDNPVLLRALADYLEGHSVP